MKKKQDSKDIYVLVEGVNPNPFTPVSGESPKVYVGRESELHQFRSILSEMLNGGMKRRFVVLGPWGSGKTTFLKACKATAQNADIPTAIISLPKYRKEDRQIEAVAEIVKQLMYKLDVPQKEIKEFLKNLEAIGFFAGALGVNVQRKIDDSSFQSFLHMTLKNLWKNLKKHKGVLILLDDVQNLEHMPEVFTTFRNVLSDEDIVGNTRIMWGMACTPKAWEQFMERDHPIGRYFTRIELENFSEKDSERIITLNLTGTGVEFSQEIKKRVWEYSNGHAYELQVLCYSLFNVQIEGAVGVSQWEKAFQTTLIELGKNVFNSWYERASKNEREILHALSIPTGTTDFTTLLKEIQKISDYTDSDLSKYLDRLEEKELITRNARGVYSIPDILFRNFIHLKNQGM